MRVESYGETDTARDRESETREREMRYLRMKSEIQAKSGGVECGEA